VAESSSGGEKTEFPTPKRLEDARNEGQVAYSTEANVAVLMLLGWCLLAMLAPWLWSAMGLLVRHALTDGMRWELEGDGAYRFMLVQGWPALQWLIVFCGLLFLAAIGISIAQVGFNPTLKPLEPKLSRLNPITGFSRMFGARGLMRFVTNLLKLIILAFVAWHALSDSMGHVTAITGDLRSRLAGESWWLFTVAMKLACVLALIAAADFLFQRWQITRDLMMTKQEVKDEMKQSEGDPHVKGKIRQIQRQMAQRRMMQEVPKADVVITNPTHVAVALKYDREAMAAPVVVAKGYDAIAQRIKAIAAENHIPMVENIPLARALAKEVDIGKPIPGKWYTAVAEVLAMVYKLKKKMGG
jgi:flagellar biosynthetic protein FlhB